PGDAINTNVHFSFVEAAKAELPGTKEEWGKQRDGWMAALREKSFAAWPRDLPTAKAFGAGGGGLSRMRFQWQVVSDPSTSLHVNASLSSGGHPYELRISSNAYPNGSQLDERGIAQGWP